jgi:hypothetical protein
VALLRANSEAIGKLAATLQPIAESVVFMRPIVDGYVVTKTKLAVLATIGFGIVLVVGWILEAGAKWLIGWILKAKFGGSLTARSEFKGGPGLAAQIGAATAGQRRSP